MRAGVNLEVEDRSGFVLLRNKLEAHPMDIVSLRSYFGLLFL